MSAILRRSSPRRAFRRYVRLDCRVVRETDFKELADVALDLSTDGMLIRTTERVLTGEELIIVFRPPGSNRIIDAAASVARVVHGRRPGDRGRALGVSFDEMRPSDRDHLWDCLRVLPAPEPLRDPLAGITTRLAM
ncbi:hypothetical protein BH09MYX1_BH09MYX1_39480 [soil metagenome]